MKLFCLLFLLSTFAAGTNAQSNNKDTVYQAVDTMPVFPGGDMAWGRYLMKNLNYPIEAVNNRDTGRIIVLFFVDKKGKVSNVRATNGPALLQEEAMRLVKDSPRWIPAIKNGEKIVCAQQQIISFSLL